MRLSLSLVDSDAVPLAGGSRPRAERMTLRTLIFWPHLIAGVVAGAIVLLMSVTGVLLTYERQLIAWSDSGFRSNPPAQGAARLSAGGPPDHSSGATTRTSKSTAVTFTQTRRPPSPLTAGRQTIYADAYTGRAPR